MQVCIVKFKKGPELPGSQRKKEETIKFQNFHFQKEMGNVNSSGETKLKSGRDTNISLLRRLFACMTAF